MTKNKKIHFIFVGRLVKEKGFDQVLTLCTQLQEHPSLCNVLHIDIFGDGDMKKELELYEKDRDFLSYHGHQPKELVMKTWKNSHYTLMPSRFLETFGLSALDSLSLGIPVVGPEKGGLRQFVAGAPECIVHKEEDLWSIVSRLVETFNEQQRHIHSLDAKNMYAAYTKKKRLERFQQLPGVFPGATILLISDYIVDVGGIEHYLINVKELLEMAGYNIHLVGCSDREKATSRYKQLFGTIWNTEAKRMVEEAVEAFQPDILWRHSIQRRMGPAPLRSQHHFPGKQRVMYHDFGLFHPYPSHVEQEEQIEISGKVLGYFRQGRSVSKVSCLLYMAKWYSSALLKGLLSNCIDVHIIPSSYMEKLVQHHYEKEILLVTLPHFG